MSKQEYPETETIESSDTGFKIFLVVMAVAWAGIIIAHIFVAVERHRLMEERGRLLAERDRVMAVRAKLLEKRDEIIAERQRIIDASNRDGLIHINHLMHQINNERAAARKPQLQDSQPK